jgi:hypothetical protein
MKELVRRTSRDLPDVVIAAAPRELLESAAG